MGFFDKFKKKENTTFDAPKNEYYKKDSSDGSISYFTYVYDYVVPATNKRFKLYLQVGKSIHVGDTEAYECTLSYSQAGGPSLMDEKFAADIKGFEKVLLCVDKERMKIDKNYTEFIFSKMLDFDRIKNLHDIQFGLKEGRKSGNYVGSVMETNGNLLVLMDHNIGDVVNISYGNLNSQNDIDKTIQLLRMQRDEIRELYKSSNDDIEHNGFRKR